MKKSMKRITLSVLILSLLTIGLTWAKYVKTLTTTFPLEILAQQFELIFDPNGGKYADGTTPKKEYARINTKNFNVPEEPTWTAGRTFMGWADKKDDREVDYPAGVKVIPVDQNILTRTLYAVWKGLDFINETVGDWYAVAQDNGDLLLHLESYTGPYERGYIKLENLEKGAYYELSFEYTGTGNRGTVEDALFGFDVIEQKTMDEYILRREENDDSSFVSNFQATSLSEEQHEENKYTFHEFVLQPDQKKVEKFDLDHEPYKDGFIATDKEMYIFLEISDIQVGKNEYVARDHFWSNYKLEKLEQPVTVKPDSFQTNLDNHRGLNTYPDGFDFELKSISGNYERFALELKEPLEPGEQYTVSFDFASDAEIHADKYEFGYSVVDKETYEEYMKSTGKLFSTWQPLQREGNGTEQSYSHTFTAKEDSMYMLFEVSALKGERGYFEVRNVQCEEATTLDLIPKGEGTAEPLDLDFSGINENIEWWPVENEAVYEAYGYEGIDAQYPYAGFDYSIGFDLYEPDIYTLPEYITVKIDKEIYKVYTDGLDHREIATGGNALPMMPVFNPETGILTIPAELLTEDTEVISVIAKVASIATESEQPMPEEMEPPAETEPSIPEETVPQTSVASSSDADNQ